MNNSQIDRDALIAVLDSLKEIEMGEDDDASDLIADAVLAHLSAIPATGEAEWDYGFRAPGVTWPARTREDAERYVNADPKVFDLVRRVKAGPWVEVTS